jgi:hypothetical protein
LSNKMEGIRESLVIKLPIPHSVLNAAQAG